MNKNEFNLGKRFKEVRLALQLSQDDMAKKLNIKQSKVSKIENNNIKADMLYIISDLCNISGISVEEFLMKDKEELIILPNKMKSLVKAAYGLDKNLLESIINMMEKIKKDNSNQ